MVFIDIYFYEDIKKICFSRRVKGVLQEKSQLRKGRTNPGWEEEELHKNSFKGKC